MMGLFERHLQEGVAEGMGPGLPFRLHPAVEVLVREFGEVPFLLRDDLLHVAAKGLHRSDLVEILLAHDWVRRGALGAHVEPTVWTERMWWKMFFNDSCVA